MTQPPRVLDPSTSPRSLFGFQVRRLREAAGRSQALLGAALHVAGETVATWEKGRSLPDARTAQRLDDELDGRGLLLAAWSLAASAGPAAVPGASGASVDDDAITGLRDPEDCGPEARLLDRAALDVARLGAWAEQLNTGDTALQALHVQVRRLSGRCLSAPPAEALAAASELSGRLFGLLREHQKPAHARELYVLTGQVCVLAGWLAGDLGAFDVADAYGRTAQAFAEHADEPGLRAWAAAGRSKTAFWRGEYLWAARHARRGWEEGRGGRCSVAVLLACQEADALSQLGASGATRDALDRAAAAADRVRPSDPVGGLLACGAARRANYAARAHVRLGEPEPALAEARRALRAADDDPDCGFGTLAQIHISRVSAHVAAGRYDGAAEAARPVLDLPRDRRLVTLTRRLRPLARALERPRAGGAAAAGSLREEIIEFCEASIGRRGAAGSDVRPGSLPTPR